LTFSPVIRAESELLSGCYKPFPKTESFCSLPLKNPCISEHEEVVLVFPAFLSSSFVIYLFAKSTPIVAVGFS
jgi:hypothetical protein